MFDKIKKWVSEHKAEVCIGGIMTVSYLALNKKINRYHKDVEKMSRDTLEGLGYTGGLLSNLTENVRDVKYLQTKSLEKGSK